MKEAKVRPKEFGTREKKYNILNTIIQSRQDVIELIHKELAYISSFFHYDLEQFFNSELLYFNAVFAFFKERNGADADEGKKKASGRLRAFIDLVVGIELLSIGLNIHSFDIDGLKGIKPCKKNAYQKEKTYTTELLFGDIFYSRAVIYLLGFGDHDVFDEILSSLKTVHKSRLALHHSILESGSKKIDPVKEICQRPPFFYGMGELLKTSFFIGMANALPVADFQKIGIYYRIVSLVTIFKTYDDMERLFSRILPDAGQCKGNGYFYDERSKIRVRIEDCMGKIEEPLFGSNLRSIYQTFT